MKNNDIYFSVDIETDGPLPGINSLLSIGAVVMDKDGNELGHWYSNFDLIPNGVENPDTMLFWKKNQHYYNITRQSTVSPTDGMTNFVEWVESFKGTPIFVAFPAGFDFTWVWWYCNRYVGRSPFSFSCIDMKTMSWCLLDLHIGNVQRKIGQKIGLINH